MSDLHERAATGARYRELLQGGEVTAALDAIEQQYADELLNSHDSDQRENLWRAVQVVRKIKAQFGSLAGNGRLATYQLTELKRLS